MTCEHGNIQEDCTRCRAEAEAEHTAAEEAKLLSIGMDMGVYAMSQLFATGRYQFTPRQWETFGWQAAQSLEQETGRPAEDLVGAMLPIIEEAIKKALGGTPK